MINLKIYIIHYTKLEERKKNILSILETIPFKYEFIEKYDKEELTNNEIDSFYEINEKVFNQKSQLWGGNANKFSQLSNSEISCALKHIEALKKIRDGSFYYNLILEDDVIINTKNFEQDINNLLTKKRKWDVLFLGEGMGKKYREDKIGFRRLTPFQNIFKMSHPATNCLEAYIVKKNTTKTILDQLTPINLAIDWELAYQFYKKDMKIFWTKKIIFKQGSKNNIYPSALR